MAYTTPKKGGIYRHFNCTTNQYDEGQYRCLFCDLWSPSWQRLVVLQPLQGDCQTFEVPFSTFLSEYELVVSEEDMQQTAWVYRSGQCIDGQWVPPADPWLPGKYPVQAEMPARGL